MPKAQHAALKRKGFSDESAYKIMNSQKKKAKAKKPMHKMADGHMMKGAKHRAPHR